MSNPWKESFEDLRSSIEQVYEEQQNAEANIIKKARQLAYDIRYEVKKSFGKDGNLNATAIKRAYLKKLSASPAPGPVKLKAKQMLVGVKEDFDFIEEGSNNKELYRVTDAETKHSYVRKADTKKAEELRRNPKIASVEKTYGAGEPYEGKYKKSGKNTVGDADGDGTKEDDSHEYAGVKDRAIKKSMAKKESFSNWREEMGENFFFEPLNEKVSPSSPYCDVMPEEQSGNKKDTQKSSQNQKLLRMKEGLNLVAEELGGELVDIQEYAAVASKILKTAGNLKEFKVPGKIPQLPRIPKLPTPKTTPTQPKPFPKPAPTEPVPKPVPQPKPGTPTKPDKKPGTPTKPDKKPGTPTKPDKKPGTPTKPGTKPGALVVPNQQTGPLAVPSNQSKPDLNPVPKNLPSPVIPRTPGSGKGPGRTLKIDIPLPGLPKGKETGREIGFVYTKQINR